MLSSVFCFRSCFFVVEEANVVNQVGWYSRKKLSNCKLVLDRRGKEQEELRGRLWMVFVVEGLVGRANRLQRACSGGKKRKKPHTKQTRIESDPERETCHGRDESVVGGCARLSGIDDAWVYCRRMRIPGSREVRLRIPQAVFGACKPDTPHRRAWRVRSANRRRKKLGFPRQPFACFFRLSLQIPSHHAQVLAVLGCAGTMLIGRPAWLAGCWNGTGGGESSGA